MLSFMDRNSTASLLISPSSSPDFPEYPSALLGTFGAMGLIGSLLDRECVRNDAGVTADVGDDKSDLADSKVSPIASSCRFALFNENSAAMDNV